MPNVLGKTFSEVEAIFEEKKLILEAVGVNGNPDTAIAISQSAEADSYVSANNKITVEFKDKNANNSN